MYYSHEAQAQGGFDTMPTHWAPLGDFGWDIDAFEADPLQEPLATSAERVADDADFDLWSADPPAAWLTAHWAIRSGWSEGNAGHPWKVTL